MLHIKSKLEVVMSQIKEENILLGGKTQIAKLKKLQFKTAEREYRITKGT